MIAAHADNRRRFSFVDVISIRVLFSRKDVIHERESLDVAGSCAQENPLPLYLLSSARRLAAGGSSLSAMSSTARQKA